jgi:hypothetical protein
MWPHPCYPCTAASTCFEASKQNRCEEGWAVPVKPTLLWRLTLLRLRSCWPSALQATRVRLHEMTQGHPAFDAGLVTVFNAGEE